MFDRLARSLLTTPTKRKIFVSYHHDEDQWYYNEFSRIFSEIYEAVQDNSVDRLVDSDDPEYVMRRIRENHITGTSCTIVLCGARTPWRKYVDWEIKATLDKQHGLIGVKLPSIFQNMIRQAIVPDRFYDNIQSGYASWISWYQLTASSSGLLQAGLTQRLGLLQPHTFLQNCIEEANNRPSRLIVNNRPMRKRNG